MRIHARCQGLFILIVLIALTIIATPAAAQFASGVEATVVDQSGAVISGAQFDITNQDTGVKQTAKSDEHGFVRILQLSPGKYRVEIRATGFRPWAQSDVVIEGRQVRTIYPNLMIGKQEIAVEVVAGAEVVETTKGSVGRTLEQKTVEESPMVGQNIYASVATLAPGVTGLGDASGSISAAGSQGTNSFNSESGFQINAAGQRQEANEFQVDGTTVNGNSRDGVVNITPQPDTVAEVRVTAATYSAEKGRQSGALIEVFTKPGTNNFHGSLSEMHVDNALTSRTEFQTKVPKAIRNDFGGTFGGPIIKNKTFFFGSLFWMKSVQGQTMTETLETKEFEDYVVQHFPNSMAARFYSVAPPASFPTSNFQTVGQIKQALWSPYAAPDIPDDLVAVGTASVSASPRTDGFQGHLRIDHNMRGDKDKLFYSMYRNTTEGEFAYARPTYSYVNPNATLYNKINYLHTFSPYVLNDASFAYTRLSGSQPDRVPELPNVGMQGVDEGFWQWGPSGWTQNNFLLNDTLTFTHGKHGIKIGIDVDRQQDLNDFTNGQDRPFFWFNNVLDFAGDQPSYQSGPVIDVRSGGVATNLYQRIMMLYAAPFVQDDWKVNNRFTINVGLRFDYFGHMSTVQNGQEAIAFFTPGAGDTFAEQVTNGSMQVRGNNGQATTNAQYRLAPRIGFAWDIFGDGTTSLHGGYGTYNARVGEYSYVNNMRTNPPYYALPTVSIYNSGVTLDSFSYGISNSGAQGFALPPGVTFEPTANGGLVGTRIAVGGIDPNLKSPLVHSWSLALQRSIKGFVVEADYFGTASRNLYLQTDVNRFPGDMVLNGGQSTRLNSSFSNITYGRSIGIANSNVAAFSVSKHFTKGWTAHAIYSYGKSLDYTSSNDNGVGGGQSVFNAQDPTAQYARSDYDSRHRFSADAVWQIPGLRTGIGHAITDGWTLSPVIILQSGQPFTVYTSAAYGSGDYNGDGFNYDVPNTPLFGNHISTSRSDYLTGLFKASDFPVPANGVEGNLGRNTFDGPGYAAVNMAVQRTFPLRFLGDAGKFELRGEFLNLFNRVNLVNPVGDLSDGKFGMSTNQHMPRQIQVVAHIRF